MNLNAVRGAIKKLTKVVSQLDYKTFFQCTFDIIMINHYYHTDAAFMKLADAEDIGGVGREAGEFCLGVQIKENLVREEFCPSGISP